MATQLESTLHVSDLILQASPVVQLVMLLLLFASLYSWYLIAKLHMSCKKAQADDEHFQKIFWSGAELNTLYNNAQLNSKRVGLEDIFYQGLGEFFLDDLWRYEAVWAIPTPAAQQALHTLLQDNSRATLMQHQPYSLVSYVWGQRYQQSNQWAIETLAAAMEPHSIRTRDQAQAWLQFKGYTPSTLHIGAWRRMGARAFR